MFSCLIVALFALLALSVSSSPVPCGFTPTPSPTPTPTPTPSTSLSPTSSAAPTPANTTSTPSDASNGGLFTGGIATYFYQNGNPGACGWYSSDNDYICAMDQARFDTSLCGKQVRITNTDNGQAITVTIADDCPTCENSNSIDLSVGAFTALSNNNLGLGVLPISWQFV